MDAAMLSGYFVYSEGGGCRLSAQSKSENVDDGSGDSG